ncbi:hypothetical protein V8C35DRAFT_329353 [Trichoderma chlorosporum]
MTDSSSLVAHNGSSIGIEDEATADTTPPSDKIQSSSYSLTRYVADASHQPPCYGPVRSITEAEERILQELRKFKANFSSGSDAL